LLVDLWLDEGSVLETVEPLWGRLCAAAEAAGATILHRHAHAFQPAGMSGYLLLAESHVSIHTWPEAGYAAIDILSCGALDPAEVVRRFVADLRVSRCRTELRPRGGVDEEPST
jgi:S-adenosylmethionine decarboxylase